MNLMCFFMVTLFLTPLLQCYKKIDDEIIKELYKYMKIHNRCKERFSSCQINEFIQSNGHEKSNLLGKISFFIIIKPKTIDIGKNYIEEWRHLSIYHEKFFEDIDVTMATIDCAHVKGKSSLCSQEEKTTFKHVLFGKLFGTKLHMNQFNIQFSHDYPLRFLMSTIERHLDRLDDWKAIKDEKIVVKNIISIVNIRKKNESDLVELLKLFKMEASTNSRIVANISQAHQTRKITVLDGSCVGRNVNSLKVCVLFEHDHPLEDPFICLAYFSLFNVSSSADIIDITNQSNVARKHLFEIPEACNSVFVIPKFLPSIDNVVKSFTKHLRNYPNKRTKLVLLSKKQMKLISFSESCILHFYRDDSKSPRKFNGSLTDDRSIDGFFELQFHIIDNMDLMKSSDLDIYNENLHDDLIINLEEKSNKKLEDLYFITPMDVKINRNVEEYVLGQIHSQNFTIVVVLQKWMTNFKALSHTIQNANQQLNKEIEIENVYKGLDCWKFDRFCQKLGVVSGYPTFFVYKNGSLVKYFKNGQYSTDTFMKIALLFFLPPVTTANTNEEFHAISQRFRKVSDIIIIVLIKNAPQQDNLTRGIINKYHGKFPIISTNSACIPESVRKRIPDTSESFVILSYEGSGGLEYLGPRILLNLEDVEMAISLAGVYHVNALNLNDLGQFKYEKRHLLLSLSMKIDLPRIRRLRESLPSTVILKYIDMSINKDAVKRLEVTRTPALVFIDFSKGQLFNKYHGLWGSMHILEWITDILKNKIEPTLKISRNSNQTVMKPRVYYENKISFGSLVSDQSMYYVSSTDDDVDPSLDGNGNETLSSFHDEL